MKTQYFELLSEAQKAQVMAALPRFKKGYKLIRRENALNGDVLFIAATMRKEALQTAEEMEQKEVKNKTKPHYYFTDVEGVKSEEIWANAKEMYALEIYSKSNTGERSMAKLPDHVQPENTAAPQMTAEELAEFLKWKKNKNKPTAPRKPKVKPTDNA